MHNINYVLLFLEVLAQVRLLSPFPLASDDSVIFVATTVYLLDFTLPAIHGVWLLAVDL